jgi:hypothetical protein
MDTLRERGTLEIDEESALEIGDEPSTSQVPIKNKIAWDHFAESVLMEGHATRKSLESDGKVPTEDESTKSPLGIEFSTEESSNRHGGAFGTKRESWKVSLRMGKLLRREKVMGWLRWLIQPVWSVCNWYDLSSLTDNEIPA